MFKKRFYKITSNKAESPDKLFHEEPTIQKTSKVCANVHSLQGRGAVRRSLAGLHLVQAELF